MSAYVLGPALAISLAVPGHVRAAQPETEAESGDPVLVEAKTLFNEGAGKFETADYEGAIDLWTKAYSILPNKPDFAQIKAKLIANIASARERAYEVDHEVGHLNQAKILLESYAEAIEDIYTSEIEREKENAWVEDRLEKIDAELQAVAERADAQAEQDAQRDKVLAPGQGLVISGSVLIGLGAAGLGVMAGGMVIGNGANDIGDIPSDDFTARESRFDRGRMGNALAIAGGAGGAVLLGTGIALLAVGLKKKKEAGGSSEKGDEAARLLPTLGPGHVGLGLSGSF
jgi:tetratricopeptide (TPR) repeat protein